MESPESERVPKPSPDLRSPSIPTGLGSAPRYFVSEPNREVSELESFERERSEVSVANDIQLTASWDGQTLTIIANTHDVEGLEVYTEQITPLPGVDIEVMSSDGFVRLFDNGGALLRLTSNPVLGMFKNGVGGDTFANLFLRPFAYLDEQPGGKSSNVQFRGFSSQIYNYEHGYESTGSCSGQFSGSSIGGILGTTMRRMVENADFERSQTEIQTDLGAIKVLGPSRFDEVYLHQLQLGNGDPVPFEICYNPSTEELRLRPTAGLEQFDNWSLEHTAGSVASGSFTVEFEHSQSDGKLAYQVDLIQNNPYALHSVTVKRVSLTE